METPETVHGRLMESVHIAGYTFERALSELEWLLDRDRWKQIGKGYENINAFLATLNFADFRILTQQRKKLAKRLAALQAQQTTTGKLLGVSDETVARDLGKRQTTNVVKSAGKNPKTNDPPIAPATNVAATWFQSDADPTREAKRITRNQERTEERARQRANLTPAALPAGRFRLLLADPPWQYEHVATESRAIENQYPTMSLDAICTLEVPAAEDAVLFLWATSPKVAEAMRVIEAWGFTYRTCAVWDKETIGMGYYFRQAHELLLVAARGALPVPDEGARPASVIRARRGAHSSKPDALYVLLETMYPAFGEADRVELFQRRPRVGWAGWRNEAIA